MKNNVKKVAAGDSTTPAGNTGKKPMNVCVDWLTCSFKFACSVQDVFIILGIEDISTLEYKAGARYEFAGYNETYNLSHIEVMTYVDDDGINNWLINMSGQGCRQFEISSKLDFVTLFAMLSNLNAVYTRLDIAIDDFEGIFTVNQFRNAVFNKQCVTNLKEWGDHRRGKIAYGDDYIHMDNFYLGSRHSRYFINVYDKRKEQENKGVEDLPETWVRTETRLSYEYADMFVMEILRGEKNLGYYITSFLNGKIAFLKPSVIKKGSNKSRLAKRKENHARWWRRFLNGAGKLKLTVSSPEKTLHDSKEWLERQVSTTLAMLHLYEPEEYGDYIKSLTKKGLEKMKDKHERKVINQFYLDKMEKKKRKKAIL